MHQQQRQASPVTFADFRGRLETLLRSRPESSIPPLHHGSSAENSLEAARLHLAYTYGLAHHELLESELAALHQRSGVLISLLQDDSRDDDSDEGADDGSGDNHTWRWIEALYDPAKEDASNDLTQLRRATASSANLENLVSHGRHIRTSLHPFALYRFVFHDLDSLSALRLLEVLRNVHLRQTRSLLGFGASFASPQWCLVTAAHPDVQRADLEALCAHLLERAHDDSTSVRARFRLVSQALALAPPEQLRALLAQWNLVWKEVEEALQGADPYADAATAAADAARGFSAGLGLGALPSIDIGQVSAGVRSLGASFGRTVSGFWR
ncbi:hypothetical protein V8E36_008693 [Tilletia maclaganii]